MQIITKKTQFQIEGDTAVAIGKFDGVHRGHKELLAYVLEAKKKGLKAAIFTFDPPPVAFFKKEPVKELTTKMEKRLLFEKMGIDYLVEYPFNEETAQVLPEDFIKTILLQNMNAKKIIAGSDLSFGFHGKGDAALLKKMASEVGFEAVIIKKICRGTREISSSFVREKLEEGNLSLVGDLIGEPFFVMGKVETGNQIGRTIGMPTVNIYPDQTKVLPPNGVYFSTIEIGSKLYYGVTNVGCKPTIEGTRKVNVETHIYDFDQDIYGENIKVNLLHFVRLEQKFENLDALKQAIAVNLEQGRTYFGI